MNNVVGTKKQGVVSKTVADAILNRLTRNRSFDANIAGIQAIEFEDIAHLISDDKNESISFKIERGNDLLIELKPCRFWVWIIDPVGNLTIDACVGDAVATSADIGAQREA